MRERLIEGMRELLWERGYVGTSPKAVQERSGAGQGSMYHHFRGKRELALLAIERSAADLVARAEADLDGSGTATERLTRYLQRERNALRGCPVGRLTMDPEVMTDQALRRPVESAFARLRTRLAQVINEGQVNGELDPSLDPETTATALTAALQGSYVLARASGSKDTYAQAIDGVLGLLACSMRNGIPANLGTARLGMLLLPFLPAVNLRSVPTSRYDFGIGTRGRSVRRNRPCLSFA
jgi:TetR/AcrR family transcriptional repressor of nem operon